MENYVTHDKKTKNIKHSRIFHRYKIYTRFASKWKIMEHMTKKSKNIKHSMHISQIPDAIRYIHVLPQNGKL